MPFVRVRQRRPRSRYMAQDGVQRLLWKDLEAFDPVGRGLEAAQHIQRILGRPKTKPRHCARMHGRKQLQACRRDDPERALGADQQLVEAVAAIVLLEAAQSVMDASVGQDRFEAVHKAAHRPEAQHLGAAGIGRNEPADRRAALGAERQREAKPLAGRRLMQILEDDPRLDHRAHRFAVHAADPVHPAERQDKGRPILGRCGAADHRCIPALRHQRDAMLGGKGHHQGRFFGRRGLEDRQRSPMPAPAPVGQPGLDTLRGRQDRLLAQPRTNLLDQPGRVHCFGFQRSQR
jgi:hypothetical protein